MCYETQNRGGCDLRLSDFVRARGRSPSSVSGPSSSEDTTNSRVRWNNKGRRHKTQHGPIPRKEYQLGYKR